MATSPEAKSRIKMQAIAAAAFTAQSFNPARVFLGVVDLSANKTFLSTLISAGPALVILPAEDSDSNTTDKIIPYSIDCVLWYGFANFASCDFTAVEDILSGTNGVKRRLRDFTNYSGGYTPPLTVSKSTRDVRTDLTPCVVTYTFTVTFKGS